MTEPTLAEVHSLTARYTRSVLAEPTGWEHDLQASEDRAAPLTAGGDRRRSGRRRAPPADARRAARLHRTDRAELQSRGPPTGRSVHVPGRAN